MGDSRDPLTFAVRLRRLRRQAGLTQEQLGLRASYSASFIKKLEAGARRASVATVGALAEALGISREEADELASAGKRRSIVS